MGILAVAVVAVGMEEVEAAAMGGAGAEVGTNNDPVSGTM